MLLLLLLWLPLFLLLVLLFLPEPLLLSLVLLLLLVTFSVTVHSRDRTTYAALFAVVGTTYGAGDGSTTFNLPDLRGEFIRGLDSGRGVDSGRALGSFQADEIKAHTHTVTTGGTGSAIDGGGDRDSDDGTQATSSFGGVETRPRNIAMNYIVKV